MTQRELLEKRTRIALGALLPASFELRALCLESQEGMDPM